MLRKRPTSICSSSTLSHLAGVSPYPNTKPISAGSSQAWGANAVCAAWESFTPQWFILHTNYHSSCFFVCLPNSGTENLHQVNLINDNQHLPLHPKGSMPWAHSARRVRLLLDTQVCVPAPLDGQQPFLIFSPYGFHPF